MPQDRDLMVPCSVLENTHLVLLCQRDLYCSLPWPSNNYLPCYSYQVFEVWEFGGRGRGKVQGRISFPWLLSAHHSTHWLRLLLHVYYGISSSQGLYGRQEAPGSQVLWRRKEHKVASSPVEAPCPPLPRLLPTR